MLCNQYYIVNSLLHAIYEYGALVLAVDQLKITQVCVILVIGSIRELQSLQSCALTGCVQNFERKQVLHSTNIHYNKDTVTKIHSE